MRHIISHSVAPEPEKEMSIYNPAAKTTIPTAAVAPALWRSTKRAAIGDTIIVANGQGVIRRPVVIDENPYPLRNMNGNDTIANIWAMKEQTDVTTLSEYSLILNKSTGNIGSALCISLLM